MNLVMHSKYPNRNTWRTHMILVLHSKYPNPNTWRTHMKLVLTVQQQLLTGEAAVKELQRIMITTRIQTKTKILFPVIIYKQIVYDVHVLAKLGHACSTVTQSNLVQLPYHIMQYIHTECRLLSHQNRATIRNSTTMKTQYFNHQFPHHL